MFDDGMTNEQSAKQEILARPDELDRLQEVVKDPATLEIIQRRKKDLRLTLDKLA